MYCSHCGTALNGNCKFCTNCGAPVKQPEPTGYPSYTYQPTNQPFQNVPPVYNSAPPVAPRQITFGEAVGTYFRKYAVFAGRATRAEYWYVILFNLAVSALFGLISSILPELGGLLSGIYSLGTMIPGWALFTRRMHDIDKSGWNWLWFLLPLAGPIVLLVFVLRASGPDNKYGPKSV